MQGQTGFIATIAMIGAIGAFAVFLARAGASHLEAYTPAPRGAETRGD